MSMLKNFENLIFILISSVIFITTGDYIEDYKKLIFLKLILISLILLKINFIEKIKKTIKENEIISIILILFIISITFSFITSPYKIHHFAFQWLRIRYLDNITDIFLFIFLYIYFKDKNLNYNYLVNSVVIPGLIFSIFVIYTFVSKKGLSDNNQDIIFFDGIRMVGMLVTFLIVFYLGCLHSIFKEKYIQNIFVLTIFMTLAILLMGRGTVVAVLASYLFMCTMLFFDKKKFKNEFLIFIFSICISIVIAQVIFHISLDVSVIRNKSDLLYTSDRFNLWKYGYFLFTENPYFGKGPGRIYNVSLE